MSGSRRITGEQIRAARALARLDQLDLARMSGVSLETVKRLETIRGVVDAQSRTLEAIDRALAVAGVELEFSPAIGVRLRNPADARQFEGRDRSNESLRRKAPSAASGVRGDEKFSRIIYHSALRGEALEDVVATLEDIFAVASARNARLEVTGALLARDGRILQLLEGPHGATRQVYASITRDVRHRDVTLLEERVIGYRRFPDWALIGRIDHLTERAIYVAPDGSASAFRPELLSPARALRLLMTLRRNPATAPSAATVPGP